MASGILQQRRWPVAVILALLCGCSGSQEIAADEPTPSSEQKQSEQQRTNRLAGESSPYLLLHAHNPVDWYPWGPEAFEKAKHEKKPIFLSIGYSSCHWCHVMERKVFSNGKIAEYMNEHFVNVKVDREERPDVDDVYMTSLQVYFQAIGSPQAGGWPLSMFLTPEGKPFAGGTYFPPEDETVEVDVTPPGGGAPRKQSVVRTGFSSVMRKVHQAWTDNRDGIEQTAAVLTREVQRVMKPGLSLTEVKLERELVDGVIKALLDSYDPVHGGIDFSPARPTAPKFPVPAKLALLQYAARNGNEQAAKVLAHTLDSIAAGGIHDHLGGGFHRYSTDRAWHVPHFEKMLYDQAQLADVYTEAYRRTGNERYRKVVNDIFRFLFREMTDLSGGFHSALDAQTDGVEGKYYVWSKEEVTKILGREDAELFGTVYGMDEERVFEHGYVLHLPRPLDEAAADLQTTSSASALDERLAGMRTRLLEARQQRKPLLKDDKILTSWNGLTIRALANAGRVLENEKYIEAAGRAATFLLDRLRDENGRLLRTFRGDEAKLNAYLDDYAFLTAGLLALYEATGERRWLDAVRDLTDRQIEEFRDDKGKGFFFTSHGHEELIARTKNAYDSVIPSGNSSSARNLIRLAALTGDEKYRRYAEETLKVFAGDLDRSPTGMANMALAIAEFLDDRKLRGNESGKTSALPGRPRDGLQTVIFRVAEEPADDSDSVEEKKKPERVQAAAHLSVDKLPAGRSCKIVILLEIKDGWHINANPVKPEFLIPTVFSIQSKQGVELKEVRYPKSKPFRVEGFDKPLAVYEGKVAIYGVLEIPAEIPAEHDVMELRIRYQACNEFQCLPPKTLRLKGKLPIARHGEPVKRINQKYFDKEK